MTSVATLPPASLMPGGHDPYVLTSELAQYCLPAANRDPNRRLAYTNSICALFLAIGLVGLRPPEPVARTVAPLEEPMITVIDAPPPPPQPLTVETSETPPETTDQPTDVAQVMVAIDTPTVVFSVPTLGATKIAPVAMASAPPSKPLPQYRPEAFTIKPQQIFPTGTKGDFPSPSYPREALMNKMMGTVVLLIKVDAAGAITDVSVKTSSGHALLDRETVKHVQRRWLFHPGEGERLYEAPIEYQM